MAATAPKPMRSPSPGNVPPVIATVPPTRLRLSGSDTEAVGERKSPLGLPSAKIARGSTPASVGGLFTAVMLTVEVTAVLRFDDALPSLSTQVTVRVGFDP